MSGSSGKLVVVRGEGKGRVGEGWMEINEMHNRTLIRQHTHGHDGFTRGSDIAPFISMGGGGGLSPTEYFLPSHD